MDAEPPHVEGVAHRWVEARGMRFHVAEAGTAGDTVVLLHGFPQHWYEWRHLIPELAADHRVVAIDLRGHGWSDAPPDGYAKEEMARDVLAVMDALDLDRVKLVGHDWGGWIGFLLCLKAPERFDRFLALNIVHPWSRPLAALPHLWRFWYQQVIIAPGIGRLALRKGAFARLILRLGVHDRSVWDRRTIDAFADRYTDPARTRAGIMVYRTFVLREFRAVMSGRYRSPLAVPTRLVFGTRDVFLSHRVLDGHQPYADLDVHLVPDCGHFIADERPDIVAEHARAFLAP
ncbi:alpha/beta fold hydrolase [Actinomadura sp. 21ATH]|uniref:alpha/beta fold hydrolase n=1 Tax=Actinomadura sp. 21ATH TaxID=1735444 RepID=UPI0035BF7990